MKRFWDKVNKTEGCWLWTAWTNNKGYGALSWKHPWGGYQNKLAHRISWELANGEIPPGMCILHKCDTPSCVRPDHLFLGTKKDNSQDMLRKGRHYHHEVRGEEHPGSKITAAQVKYARLLYFAERRSAPEIAEFFGLSKHIIADIMRGKTWTHI